VNLLSVSPEAICRDYNYNKTIFGEPRTPLGELTTHEEGYLLPNLLPFRLGAQGRLVLLLNWYPHFLDESCAPVSCHSVVTCLIIYSLASDCNECVLTFDVCRWAETICEPSHFSRINSRQFIDKHLGDIDRRPATVPSRYCNAVTNTADLYAPAYDPRTGTCFLQTDRLLFSCVDEKQGLTRICPCRDYIEGQTALCRQCL